MDSFQFHDLDPERCYAMTQESQFDTKCTNYHRHDNPLLCQVHVRYRVNHPDEFTLHPAVRRHRVLILDNPDPEARVEATEDPVPAPIQVLLTPPATPRRQAEDQAVARAPEHPDTPSNAPVPQAPTQAPPTPPATPRRQAEDQEVGTRVHEPANPEPDQDDGLLTLPPSDAPESEPADINIEPDVTAPESEREIPEPPVMNHAAPHSPYTPAPQSMTFVVEAPDTFPPPDDPFSVVKLLRVFGECFSPYSDDRDY
ncbi:uncharacterized protein BJ171DRAFT_575619 [Polychytrium aggregatum]|uniref:uncharacterized protein n=1 Tax=Polychytrium aggregatum TaxID=110093 RepID=UPI0022FEB299|nr:uncharacterized protein BJ171DRAFT_575619 [Polychytrium aggregatum]KAI9188580.1 hypothetical protein BJ171DRAFT_575619 [Polychytrium aggregatum]